MNILLLSCGTGGGHNAAAAAVKEALEQRGHTVEWMEPYSLLGDWRGRWVTQAVNKSYIRSVQRTPHLFGVTYQLGALYEKYLYKPFGVPSPVYGANLLMRKPFARLFAETHFDAVVVTHVYPGEILAGMRNSGMDIPPVFWVSTDYDRTAYTEETHCDYYVIAHEDLTRDYTDWGIPEEKLFPLGIPVLKSFRQNLTKQQARQQLDIPEDHSFILVSGGSVGSGKLLETVTLLAGRYRVNDRVSIIAVCGHNLWLYRRLRKVFGDNVLMLGHTDRMAEYMAAADLIIAKPGGLSTTEAAVIGRPLIFISPIPGGPEKANIRFFTHRNMARYAKNIGLDLLPLIDTFKDPAYCHYLASRQKAVIHADAADQIARLVEERAGDSSRTRTSR